MKQVCNTIGISRQGYYKGRKKKQRKKLQEEMIIKLVQSHRRKMPLIGGKKLYKMLIPDFERMKIKIGRDRFFSLLRKNELLVRRKRRFAKTTNSSHRFKIYKNLIKEIEPMNPDEIYVSDIAYLRAEDSFCYLALISDLYSRKIVGYDVSDSLNLEGSIRALKMAIKNRKDLYGLIHHSDRGIQYCSNIYTELLTEHQIQISMSDPMRMQ